ncbi:MAG: hypothetical protein IT340_23755 [Chloroflexi bacterium]|nr:hypothetical protein [Chloroflexota bacterium]
MRTALDIDGTGQVATPAGLTTLGVTDAERQQLALLYPVGKQLWRVAVTHFSSWDLNWGFGPPEGAVAPRLTPLDLLRLEDVCPECQRQVVSQSVDVAGTPFRLHYQSDRVPGHQPPLQIPLTGANLPPGLQRVDLEVLVAGQRSSQSFGQPTAHMSATYTWDGKEGYGRTVQGSPEVRVRVGYAYIGSYARVSLFGAYGSGVQITGDRQRQEVVLWQEWRANVTGWDARQQGLGGWSLDIHHAYDSASKVLHLGDGRHRGQAGMSAVITTVAGTGVRGYAGDGGPAAAARLDRPHGLAVGSDGSLYIADHFSARVRRVDPDGIISTFTDAGDYTGSPVGLAVGADGSLYVANGYNAVRRVHPDGTAVEFASILGGVQGFAGDGGPAIAARLHTPSGLAVGPDGSVYIADTGNHRVRRVGPDGIITTVAGTGTAGYEAAHEDGLATLAHLNQPTSVAVGPDGGLYIADRLNYRVRRVGPDGRIITVAGNGTSCSDPQAPCGDGGPAATAALQIADGVVVGPDSSLYIAGPTRIRRVGSDGIITGIGGGGAYSSSFGDGGPATQAYLRMGAFVPSSPLALGADGTLYASMSFSDRVRRIAPALPGTTLSATTIAAEDGSALYQFDALGRHTHTISALTGAVSQQFGYDDAGRLRQVTDRHGNVTLVERDGAGNPTAIVGPFGQRTTLRVDANGYLDRITNPANETVQLAYQAGGGGLLTGLTPPRGGAASFEYQAATGRLIATGDAVAGSTHNQLQRTEAADGFTTAVTVASSATAAHTTGLQAISRANGEREQVTTASTGAVTRLLVRPDETRVTTDPTGVQTTVTYGPDPRWGMQAPLVTSVTKKANNGAGPAFYTMTASRTVTLVDPAQPQGQVQSQVDVVTVNGRTTRTEYNHAARTISVTNPAGQVTTTILDSRDRPVTATVTDRAPVTYAYNAGGLVTSTTQGSGADARTFAYTYTPAGYQETITDPLNGVTHFTYDAAGRVLTQTLPTNHVTTFTYDAAGNVTSQVDPAGVRTTYEYDDRNRLTAQVLDPAGRAVRTEYTYDLANNQTKVIEDAGAGRLNVTTQHSYVPIGAGRYAVGTMTDPLSRQTSYTYTPFGAVSTVTDPAGHTTTTTYTPQGWPEKVRTHLGRETITTYNDDGQPTSVTDPRGVKTTYAYDPATGRRLTETTGAAAVGASPALNLTTTYAYRADGQLSSVTDARGKVSTRAYDAFGRLMTSTDPTGHTTTLEYDTLNRVTKRIGGSDVPGEAVTTAYAYDASSRLLSERVDPTGLNLTTAYRYTRAGSADTWRRQEVEDPRGNVTAYRHTALGVPDLVTDALGRTWGFAHDNLGRLTGQTDPNSHATTFAVDPLGRRVGLTQDGRSESWAYNPDGTLGGYTDFAGRTTTYGYDADQRRTGIDHPVGTADVTFAYDPAGNVASMTDGLGTTTYAYDAANRLKERTRDGRTVGYDYAATGQVGQVDYWGRGSVQYGHDDAGRVTGLTPWGTAATAYTYRSSGRLASQSRGNGVATSYSYDPAGRLTRLLHQQGATTLQDFQYVLDPAGNRTQVTDGDGATTFTYDALNRLTQAGYPAIASGPAAGTVPYTLDPVGNRLGDGTTTLTYDAADRITSAGYSYDANGNLLGDGATTYAYDTANRLTSTTKGGVTTTYGYDGWGNLVRETVSGVTTDLVLDEQAALPRVLGAARSDGTETLYGYGPEGVSSQRAVVGGTGQAVEPPLLDALGSVRHLTDASGAVTLSRRYDAFGGVRHSTGTTTSRLGYTGEWTNPADGTVYLRERHYQPALGRFLQRDAFAGAVEQPQSLHRYAYAHNNPTTLTDPSGRCVSWGDNWCREPSLSDWTKVGKQPPPSPDGCEDLDALLHGAGNQADRRQPPPNDCFLDPGLGTGAVVVNLLCTNLGVLKVVTVVIWIPNPLMPGGGYYGVSFFAVPSDPGDPNNLGDAAPGGRDAEGIAKGGENLPHINGQWLHGSHGNAGLIPGQIADTLRGRSFKNFNEFRRAFWRAVADDAHLANQFTASSCTRMRQGLAPLASLRQHANGEMSYILHHKHSIHDGGDVCDMDNLIVVTPRYHRDVLDPSYHYDW